MTSVRPEWLIEIAPAYYDLSNFQKGDVKLSLERIKEKVDRLNELKQGKNKRRVSTPRNRHFVSKKKIDLYKFIGLFHREKIQLEIGTRNLKLLVLKS